MIHIPLLMTLVLVTTFSCFIFAKTNCRFTKITKAERLILKRWHSFRKRIYLRREKCGGGSFKILILVFPHFMWNKTWKQNCENGQDTSSWTKSGMQPNTCSTIIWKDNQNSYLSNSKNDLESVTLILQCNVCQPFKIHLPTGPFHSIFCASLPAKILFIFTFYVTFNKNSYINYVFSTP